MEISVEKASDLTNAQTGRVLPRSLLVGSWRYVEEGTVPCHVHEMTEDNVLRRSYEVAHRPHLILPTLDQKRVLVVGDLSTSSSIIYLDENRVRPLTAMEGHHFYGHACRTPDPEVFYFTEYDLSGRTAVITLRDLESWEIRHILNFGEGLPHEALTLGKSGSLAVALCKKPLGEVVFVDVETGQFEERVCLTEGMGNWQPEHFDYRAGDDLLAVGVQDYNQEAPHTCLAALIRNRREVQYFPFMTTSTKTKRQGLSVRLHPTLPILGVTCPFQNMVHFWDIDSGTLAHTLPLNAPTAIEIVDGKFCISSYPFQFTFFDFETKETTTKQFTYPIPGETRKISWTSHFYRNLM
jgi:hypothetical protein